jgi:hypothetical protein
MVAMTPLIVIQLMGLVYVLRTRKAAVLTERALVEQEAIVSVSAPDKVIDWGAVTVYGEGA